MDSWSSSKQVALAVIAGVGLITVLCVSLAVALLIPVLVPRQPVSGL